MNEKSFLTQISLVIPVYNEEERIKKSLSKILPYLNQLADYEIIFVDDGSTDRTLLVLEEYKNKRFRVIKNGKNCGKGYSVQQGMLRARYPVVLFSDADFSTPIEDLEKLLPHLENYDIVIGSRGSRRNGNSILRKLMAQTFLFFRRLVLLPKLIDTQCGFKVIKTKLALNLFPRLQFFQSKYYALPQFYEPHLVLIFYDPHQVVFFLLS